MPSILPHILLTSAKHLQFSPGHLKIFIKPEQINNVDLVTTIKKLGQEPSLRKQLRQRSKVSLLVYKSGNEVSGRCETWGVEGHKFSFCSIFSEWKARYDVRPF